MDALVPEFRNIFATLRQVNAEQVHQVITSKTVKCHVYFVALLVVFMVFIFRVPLITIGFVLRVAHLLFIPTVMIIGLLVQVGMEMCPIEPDFTDLVTMCRSVLSRAFVTFRFWRRDQMDRCMQRFTYYGSIHIFIYLVCELLIQVGQWVSSPR